MNGQIDIPLKYDEVSVFDKNVALVKEGNTKKIIDRSGNVVGVMPSTIEKPSAVIKHHRVAVKSGSKWGYMDTSGEMVKPCQFEEAYNFQEELVVVKKDGKYGFINDMGKLATPFAFLDADSFYNGFAAVKLQGDWGLIDKTGRLRIPARFKSPGKFYGNEVELELASDRNSLFPAKARLNKRSMTVLEED